MPPLAPTEAAPSLAQDGAVVALVGLAHASSHFSHLLLAPLFGVFMQEFGVGFADLGLLTSLFFVVSCLGQACSGFVVDRIGARPLLFTSLALFFIAASVAATAHSYTSLVWVALLAGLGNAPFHPVDFSILNQRVSAGRLPLAFSAHGLSGSLGWALAPVFLVGITSATHWRTAYWAAAGFYAVIFLLLASGHRLLRTQAPQPQDKPTGADQSGFAFLRLPVVWRCFVFFVFSTFAVSVVQNFLPSILVQTASITPDGAAKTLTAYLLLNALGMLLGGFLLHFAAHWRTSSIVASSIGTGAILLLFAAAGELATPALLATLAATGLVIGLAAPSRDLMIKRASPSGATGRVYGMVYSGFDVGLALAPLVLGRLMDRGWYRVTLATAGLSLLLAAWIALGSNSKK